MARPDDYPTWAPPRWALGVFWRWWIASPTRILANYIVSVVFIACWWVALVSFHVPSWWIIWAAALTPLLLLAPAVYGPRVWRASRDD